MKTDIAYIYALIDPRDNQIRYIGKTISPKSRLKSHITECRTADHYRARWINILVALDIRPIMKILKICPLVDFVKYETYYIKLYKDNKLTNSDETGQGNVNRHKEIIDKAAEKISRIVYQYDLDGNFIEKYKSTRDAALKLSLSHSNISRCCNGISKHAGGFIFKYNQALVEKVINPNALRKKIVEIDKSGNIISMWDSIMECSRDTKVDHGNLSRVCNGKRGSVKGRFFKFI